MSHTVGLTPGAFGVKLCGASGLRRQVQRSWNTLEGRDAPTATGDEVTSLPDFVSHGMIRSLRPGTVLNVASNAIITHLARDEAAASGVRIKREGD